MEDTAQAAIERILKTQRDFFATHQTKDISFRIENLKRFKAAIQKYEARITEALWLDLRKSYEEAYLTEISLVTQEINYHIKHLKKWSKPRRVSTPVHLLPSSSQIAYEPLGVALIIAPWNYPFQLLMNPLVGAISAGCCAILKPSEFTPHIAMVMEEMVRETFPENYIAMVQGGQEVGEALLRQRFDVIFFTGSTAVGKIVMKAAAEHLTPVILELGGKSPCIVDEDANISIAARRIAWGKGINAGQTCIAPDYLFVHRSVKDQLIQQLATSFEEMYGKDIEQSDHYPRIVNEKAHDRLVNLMQHGEVKWGGTAKREQKYIAPTILDNVNPNDPMMQEEIFGPLLPVIPFSSLNEVLAYINANEKPLALYYFGKNKGANEVLAKTTSGGACINDTIMHITNHNMPFGGVGSSGLGKYHGRDSFLAFSHQRAIVSTPTWIDLPLKYAPFKYFKYIRRII